jgi:hypothetical protein
MKNSLKFQDLEIKLKQYISNLNTADYNFIPVNSESKSNMTCIQLGFLCYGLKTMYTLNDSKLENIDYKSGALNKIISFQNTSNESYKGYFIDENYVKAFKKNYYKVFIKNVIKFILRKIKFTEINPNKKLNEFLRAETKQSIATISQFNTKPKVNFHEYPTNQIEIKKFISRLDWRFPWNAGAQVSGMCVFISFDENKIELSKYINSEIAKLVKSDGAYYIGSLENESEKINGAMKVLTGLDWLNIPIHKPKELIDLCLSHEPNREGCDIVDVIYVLYKCNDQIDYKKNEIKSYVEELIPIIMTHFKEEEGGFSYYSNKSQEFYYGVKISEGKNEADLHGTTLLTWALSMIFSILGHPYPRWKVIKP